jgi:hypothetical protein
MALNPNLNKCHLTKAGTMILPVGRLSYPNLFKARAMPGAGEDTAKFSTSLIMPPDSELKPAGDWVLQLATEKWGPKGASDKIKKPILRHAEKTEDADLAAAFPYLVRCSTINRPTVVFGSGEECTSEEEVYPGRWARISVRGYAWEHPTGGRGVSFGLSNVMLLDHDERIGGGRAKVEDEFADFFESGGSNFTGAGNGSTGKGSGKQPDSLFD